MIIINFFLLLALFPLLKGSFDEISIRQGWPFLGSQILLRGSNMYVDGIFNESGTLVFQRFDYAAQGLYSSVLEVESVTGFISPSSISSFVSSIILENDENMSIFYPDCSYSAISQNVTKYAFGELESTIFYSVWNGTHSIFYQKDEGYSAFSFFQLNQSTLQIEYFDQRIYLLLGPLDNKVLYIYSVSAMSVPTYLKIQYLGGNDYVQIKAGALYYYYATLVQVRFYYTSNFTMMGSYSRSQIADVQFVGSFYLLILHSNNTLEQYDLRRMEKMASTLLSTAVEPQLVELEGQKVGVIESSINKISIYQLLDIKQCLGGICYSCSSNQTLLNQKCYNDPYIVPNIPQVSFPDSLTATQLNQLPQNLSCGLINVETNFSITENNTVNSTQNSTITENNTVNSTQNSTTTEEAIALPNLSIINNNKTQNIKFQDNSLTPQVNESSQEWLHQMGKYLGDTMSFVYAPTIFKGIIPIILFLEDTELYKYHKNVIYTPFQRICMNEIQLINALRINPRYLSYISFLSLDKSTLDRQNYNEVYKKEIEERKSDSIWDAEIYWPRAAIQLALPSLILHVFFFACLQICKVFLRGLFPKKNTVGHDFATSFEEKMGYWGLICMMVDPNIAKSMFYSFNQLSAPWSYSYENMIYQALNILAVFILLLYSFFFYYFVNLKYPSSSSSLLTFTKNKSSSFFVQSGYLCLYKSFKSFAHSNLIPTHISKLGVLIAGNSCAMIFFLRFRKNFGNYFLLGVYFLYEMCFFVFNATLLFHNMLEEKWLEESIYEEIVFWEIIGLITCGVLRVLISIFTQIKGIITYFINKYSRVNPVPYQPDPPKIAQNFFQRDQNTEEGQKKKIKVHFFKKRQHHQAELNEIIPKRRNKKLKQESGFYNIDYRIRQRKARINQKQS